MSNLAKVDDGEYRPARVTGSAIDKFIEEPLSQVPREWQLVVYDFWLANSHFLRDQLALAAKLRHWMALGLELDDLRLVLGHLLRPEVAAEFDHAGKLMAALAKYVAMALRRKKALQRKPTVRQVQGAGEVALIKVALAKRFAWAEDDDAEAADRP